MELVVIVHVTGFTGLDKFKELLLYQAGFLVCFHPEIPSNLNWL
jgi:hypothetical protein